MKPKTAALKLEKKATMAETTDKVDSEEENLEGPSSNNSVTPQRKQIAVRPTDEIPAMEVIRSPVRTQNNLIDGKMTMANSKSFSSVASGTWKAGMHC